MDQAILRPRLRDIDKAIGSSDTTKPEIPQHPFNPVAILLSIARFRSRFILHTFVYTAHLYPGGGAIIPAKHAHALIRAGAVAFALRYSLHEKSIRSDRMIPCRR